jgi:hypothetical protein
MNQVRNIKQFFYYYWFAGDASLLLKEFSVIDCGLVGIFQNIEKLV